MDSAQRKVAAQVRLHKHLYDSSMREHRDNEMIANSWREIADNLGEEEAFCRRLWKNIRDRFVKAKKRSHMKCSVLGGVAPPILLELGWLAQFTRHRESDSFDIEDDGAVRVKVPRVPQEISNQEESKSSQDVRIPRSSLHLVVPPLRLMSACMWQVAKERNVDHYDKLAEFVVMVTDNVPELMNYKQKTQLILGLRARLLLEDLKRKDKVDYKSIQGHLDSFQEWTTNDVREEDQDEEVESSKSAFMELIQTLLTNESEKNKYFKEVFSVQYGARFDTALQILVWEFFSRLEEFLPVPSFSQVSSMFDISSLDHEFEQCVYEPEDLKRIFQHQQERHKLAKSEFTLMSDTILSTLASKQTSGASEDHAGQKIIQIKLGQKTMKQEDGCSGEYTCEDDEETDDSSTEANPDSRLNEYRLSPLTSSSCYDDADAAGDDETAGEAALRPQRCPRSSVEGAKEHLDLSRNKEASGEFTYTSDTILSTLASKQTSMASEDHQKISQITSEQKTQKQEDGCSVEYVCEDDEDKDDSSVETNPNSRPHECGLSPLTSSPRYEEVAAAGGKETAGGSAFQPPRCSQSSLEGMKEHLDLGRNKEASEKSNISLQLTDNPQRPTKNTCLECGKTFATYSHLKSHHVAHSSVRPFKCNQCDKSYKRRKDLKLHYLIHSNPKVLSFACSLCDKRFSSRALLTVHLRHHSGERPFACSYCDKRFLTNPVLKSHVRIHTGERPYACTFCDKTFKQLYPRTVHLRMHMKEKPYLCSTCGMSFCSSGALLVHSRTHTGERPYQCDFCDKGFATSVRLTMHRRFHTGERPYSCSECDKRFRCSSGLKKHMRTHTGEKPYKCLTCHKTFSQHSNMKIHLRVHKNV